MPRWPTPVYPARKSFITTKLWLKDHGYAKTKDAFRVSMDNLRLDYLDLDLIHQPFNDYYSASHAMEELLDDGQIRAIGVSNFYDDRDFDLVTHNRVVPAVNQRETHPPQPADCDPGASAAIRHRASSLVAPGSGKRSSAHGVQRWCAWRKRTEKPFRRSSCAGSFSVTSRLSSKSTRPERLRENIEVFDFQLADDEMRTLASLDEKRSILGLLTTIQGCWNVSSPSSS